MKINFQKISDVIQRELNLLKGDKNIIIIVLIAPLFYSFFYATIYLNKIETNVPVVVVDDDRTETTQQLRRNIDAHQLIEIAQTANDLATAEKMLNKYLTALIF